MINWQALAALMPPQALALLSVGVVLLVIWRIRYGRALWIVEARDYMPLAIALAAWALFDIINSIEPCVGECLPRAVFVSRLARLLVVLATIKLFMADRGMK